MIRGIGLLDGLVGGLVYGNEIGRVGNLGDLSSSTILGFGARLRIRTLVVRVLGVLEVPWAEIFFLWVWSPWRTWRTGSTKGIGFCRECTRDRPPGRERYGAE